MSQANLEIIGGKAVRRMFDIAAQKIGPQLNKEMNASALTIEKTAKQLAPANLGKLRQSIKHNIGEPLMKSVYSELKYAPYVEFGTGKKVFQIKGGGQVDPKYQRFASQFKGKGKGGYDDLILALLHYVKRKKLAGTYKVKSKKRQGNANQKLSEDLRVAERMAYFILKNGLPAQPFLIPAYEMEKPKLIKRIQNLLKK